jgi:endonuclease G
MMMKYVRLFLPAVILLLAISCSKRAKTVDDDEEVASTLVGTVDVMTKGWLEIPVYEAGKENKILRRKGYTTSYNRRTKQPDWVAWRLTKQHTYGDNRRDFMEFHEDMEVSAPRATDNDYFRSGYDRGHMCPGGDCNWNSEGRDETFLLSNMCPQNPNLNRGDWKEIEIACRKWAQKYGHLYIVCGPIFFKSQTHVMIGDNRMPVPEAFFKVVLCLDQSSPKGIGFICRNTDGNRKKDFYVNTIRQVERVMGYKFFPNLSDSVRNIVLDMSDINEW